MRSLTRKVTAIVVCLFSMLMANASVQSTPTGALKVLPNPVLALLGQEFYQAGGKDFTRYRYTIENLQAYPDELFTAAPALPPCGANTKASRTWVDFYDQRGKRLYGFCALGKPGDLSGLWFALESDVVPPSWVYIEMTDRQTGTKYKSNLAETTL